MISDNVITGPQPGPQEMFCASKATIALGGGSFFGGKSISLVMEAGRNVDHPSYRGAIFRRTSKQITDSGGLGDISMRLYPQLGGEPTEDNTFWVFPSGAEVKFNNCEHDSDMFNYRSSQFCFLGIDQLEEFPMSVFFYLRARNRPAPGYDRRCYNRNTCNPQPGWLADFIRWWWDPDTGYPIKERSGIVKYFIRKKDEIAWVDKSYREQGRDGVIIKPVSFTFIPSTPKDNPKGMATDPNYESNIASMDSVSVERYLYGNWKVNYAGGMFDPSWFRKIKMQDVPKGLRKLRYWDFATSEVKEGTDPDYTSGGFGGISGGDLYIIDINRFRETPAVTLKNMKESSEADGFDTGIRWEEEKGSAGRFVSSDLVGKFLGYDAQPDPVSGDKVTRAKPLSVAAQHGHVFIVEGPWNADFLSELSTFPKKTSGNHLDQVDCISGLLKCLTQEKRIWNTFSVSQTKVFTINWNEGPEYTVYAAFYQNRQSEVFTLGTVWDNVEGKLYVYWHKKYSSVIPELIVMEAIKALRLRVSFNCSLVCNDLMAGEIGNRTTAQLIGEALKKSGVSNSITEPALYEPMGSLAYIGALFATDSILVHQSLAEPAAQFSGWTYKENGREPNDGYEYCRCLCLIGAALKNWVEKERIERRQPDYHPVEKKKPLGKVWQTV